MKVEVKKAGRQRKWTSITKLVKAMLKENEVAESKAILRKVKEFFPKSKCNDRHVSWYRVAYKKGKLKGVK